MCNLNKCDVETRLHVHLHLEQTFHSSYFRSCLIFEMNNIHKS